MTKVNGGTRMLGGPVATEGLYGSVRNAAKSSQTSRADAMVAGYSVVVHVQADTRTPSVYPLKGLSIGAVDELCAGATRLSMPPIIRPLLDAAPSGSTCWNTVS